MVIPPPPHNPGQPVPVRSHSFGALSPPQSLPPPTFPPPHHRQLLPHGCHHTPHAADAPGAAGIGALMWLGRDGGATSASTFVPPLPEDVGQNIIPVYCSLLAAVVVGLLAYVAFKCWHTCRQKQQLAKARAAELGTAAEGEKLHSDSGVFLDTHSLEEHPHLGIMSIGLGNTYTLGMIWMGLRSTRSLWIISMRLGST
uniref:Tumor necrosis factor receptor member 16 transmembrane domain-containing protein n=1 Tax=Meleagris gallopavo TaxID=9103 RepID=A0A803YD82_MELGA